jgi:LysM repeat protein
MDGRKVYGTRWMGLSKPNYGIHGTNNPSSIGKAVSLGCIRMYNQDIESIFSMVSLGTPVDIISGTKGSGYPLPPYNPPSQKDFMDTTGPGVKSKIYVVKNGDTLWSIAQKFGLLLDELINMNPGLSPDLIYPGQVIYLP